MRVSMAQEGEEEKGTLKGRGDGRSRSLRMGMGLYMCRVVVLMVQQSVDRGDGDCSPQAQRGRSTKVLLGHFVYKVC